MYVIPAASNFDLHPRERGKIESELRAAGIRATGILMESHASKAVIPALCGDPGGASQKSCLWPPDPRTRRG